MKSKLTLSLSEPTIRTAKRLAQARHTTVSALFTASVEQWEATDQASSEKNTNASLELRSLLGVFRPEEPFDIKSARIRKKHG